MHHQPIAAAQTVTYQQQPPQQQQQQQQQSSIIYPSFAAQYPSYGYQYGYRPIYNAPMLPQPNNYPRGPGQSNAGPY